MIPLFAPLLAKAAGLSMAAKAAAILALVMVLLGAGLYYGNKMGKSSCLEAIVNAQKQSIKAIQKQGVVNDKVVTVYVDRVQTVQGKSRTIIKEVQNHALKLSTVLSGDFRVLHDGAAHGTIPSASDYANAAPVEATAVAETVVGNYGICHENAETLSALQGWIRQQAGIE